MFTKIKKNRHLRSFFNHLELSSHLNWMLRQMVSSSSLKNNNILWKMTSFISFFYFFSIPSLSPSFYPKRATWLFIYFFIFTHLFIINSSSSTMIFWWRYKKKFYFLNFFMSFFSPFEVVAAQNPEGIFLYEISNRIWRPLKSCNKVYYSILWLISFAHIYYNDLLWRK